MMLRGSIRRSLARWRRTGCEALGIARYSRPALHGIDRKLERVLDRDGGRFIEAGANDGVAQSNTYYLEKLRGWTGILVEPMPELAAECRRNRRVPVVEAALVATEISGATVEMRFAGLMSVMNGALGDAAVTAAHVADGLRVQALSRSYLAKVPARTLSGIIDEAGDGGEIDLLSLDVEGGEVAALQGLDFARHAPRFICIEARARAAIDALLDSRYRLREILTDLGAYQDVLYERR